MTGVGQDCFAVGERLLRAAEALDRITDMVEACVGSKPVPIRAAAGRILAEDVTAACRVPPHDNAAVDGYALRLADMAQSGGCLTLWRQVAAGHPVGEPLPPGMAARIFTGAPIPAGADLVVPQEACRVDGDRVWLPPDLRAGRHVRRAGEDVAPGRVVLRAGTRLRPQDLGLAAAIGCASLMVRTPLRVAIFSTGDELRDAGMPLPPGCIYDSNRVALGALLAGLGAQVDDLGILPDQPQAVRHGLGTAASGHDLIVTSGGMSVGEADHLKAAVAALGQLHIWRLAIKPGKPVALGQVAGVPFVGLPGNPVAMMVTFLAIARPLVLRLSGARPAPIHRFPVTAAFHHHKRAGLREWLRVELVQDRVGGLTAVKFPHEGAGVLSSMVAADGLVELGEDVEDVRAGTTVDFLPFAGLA
ncbi:MAG: molybdopterin molybdenumtransferase MoeA [Alphaproteobacteria bacterium]|nr:molybdopterin molybdenumtransferase MoeA [Alphaproteobacteria bacterium]